MSTRGYVGYKNQSGDFVFIYNHFDSNPSCLGRDLFSQFTTLESVVALVDKGDMQYIGNNYDGRDIRTSSNVPTDQEYTYIFEDGVWYVWEEKRYLGVLNEDMMKG